MKPTSLRPYQGCDLFWRQTCDDKIVLGPITVDERDFDDIATFDN